jgi:hypothetical protein
VSRKGSIIWPFPICGPKFPKKPSPGFTLEIPPIRISPEGGASFARISSEPLNRVSFPSQAPSGQNVYFRLTQDKPWAKLSSPFGAALEATAHSISNIPNLLGEQFRNTLRRGSRTQPRGFNRGNRPAKRFALKGERSEASSHPFGAKSERPKQPSCIAMRSGGHFLFELARFSHSARRSRSEGACSLVLDRVTRATRPSGQGWKPHTFLATSGHRLETSN